ncbi:hypothetical protein Tco_0103147 [Tanacetum coccineum]
MNYHLLFMRLRYVRFVTAFVRGRVVLLPGPDTRFWKSSAAGAARQSMNACDQQTVGTDGGLQATESIPSEIETVSEH